MVCKFRADGVMNRFPFFPSLSPRVKVATLAALLLCAGSAWAERGDRSKPLEVESDGGGSAPGAVMDLGKKTVVLSGNVVITQGTMRIRADRVELRETPDGRRTAVASGSAGRPASFRQKRDRVDEYVDATAERIEYDSRSDQIRFVGDARSRRMVGNVVADEATAQTITYDNVADVVSLQGSNGSTAAAPGRTRLVLMPREALAPAASAPDASPPTPPTSPAPDGGADKASGAAR
jgi:lipopolysaccharide export system protein LptA